MKKGTLLFCTLLCAGSSVQAQQIQGDFDEQKPWVDGKGTTVKGWDVLNVIQMGSMKYPLTFSDTDHDVNNPDGKSVRMECQFLGLMGMGSNSPSYMTLGKTWVYADIAGVMSQTNGDKSDPDDSDGGAVGGIEFSHRPDSICGFFKRTLGTENPEEAAKIIVYSWTGTTTSDAPANIGTWEDMSTKTEDAPRQTLIDREIDILGKNSTGKSAEGVSLISHTEYDIKGSLEEWKRISVPINYLNDNTPEKLNVIISAANYYDRSQIGKDNKLWADDVRFIYNAKLKGISLNGEMIPGFDEDIFEYVLPEKEMEKELKAEAWGQNAQIKISNEGNKYIIQVTDETAKGEKTYTYTITFHGEETIIKLPEEIPAIHYGDSIADLGFESNNTSPFEYEISDPTVLTTANGKLVALSPGTVQIIAKQAIDANHASATSQPLKITIEKAPLIVGIKDGATCQRGINANVSGKTDYELELEGLKLDDASKAFSEIFTKMPKLTGDAPETEEQIGGSRNVALSDGEAVNYTLTYAENCTMTVAPNIIDVYVDYAGGGRFNANQSGENYHKLKVAAGQDAYIFTLSYFFASYDDKEVLEKENLIDYLTCSVNKEAQVGEEFAVTMSLPDKDYEKFRLNLLLPDDAKIVLAENPNIQYYNNQNVVYGNEPLTLANCENKITYKITNRSNEVVNVDRNTVATIKNAGHAEVIIGSAAKDKFGATAQRISFEVEKANLVITATDDTIKAGEATPEHFQLKYEGFVYEDSINNVFQTEPKAYIEESGMLEAGTYPIRIAAEETPANYNLTLVEGILTVDNASGIQETVSEKSLSYTDGCLINPAGGEVSIYSITGTHIGTYSGTRIPVKLNAHIPYLVKNKNGVYKLIINN